MTSNKVGHALHIRLSLKSIWQGSPESTTAGTTGQDELGAAPVLEAVLNGVVLAVTVALEAARDKMVGFKSAVDLGGDEAALD